MSLKLGHEREYEHLGNGVEKAILNEERLNGEQRLGEKTVRGKRLSEASSLDDSQNYLATYKRRMLDVRCGIVTYRYLSLPF